MDASPDLPPIIQGGMGVGVSGWRLARSVSRAGQLGVVSGTALDTTLVRRLEDGDEGGHLRRALEHFPIPGVVEQVLRRFFRPDGRPPATPYRLLSMHAHDAPPERQAITTLGAFVEVWLAKHGHARPVGMNLLTKLQLPNLATLYGAMLAGVDVVLMGAGIPREIPGALDRLASHEPASLTLEVAGARDGDELRTTFDPRALWSVPGAALGRPRFYAIVGGASLASMLVRKASGRVDGFVVESPLAGGHNAPPRGAPRFDALGEPIYGARDVVDPTEMAALGLPFWIAGGESHPERLVAARAAGAAGIQVGTLFAYCDESGMSPELRRQLLAAAAAGEVAVRTDARASPTGYPFKLVRWPDDPDPTAARPRVCDLGGLRSLSRTPDRRLVQRCPSEPLDAWVAKGGLPEDALGRRCLCNGLTATVGLGQVRRDGRVEPPLVTSGDALLSIGDFLRGRLRYGARDVIDWLLGRQDVHAKDA
ncbi:MAG: nitronate monooxygenase [Planctomycetes bacterium]|nr:nitronate monooxygenase [Planctomycetota bacterium]